MISLGFPPNLPNFDPVIIEKDQIDQKENGFLQSISSGTYITFTSSKLFNIFFLSGIDTPLKSNIVNVPIDVGKLNLQLPCPSLENQVLQLHF